ACYPATLLYYASGNGPSKSYKPKKLAGPRHERAAKVVTGMKPVEVLDLLGPPDYMERGMDLWECAWRYDLDAARPYSLLVVRDDRPKVKAIAKVEPPLWLGNDLLKEGAKQAVFDANGSIVYSYAKNLYSTDFKGRLTPVR